MVVFYLNVIGLYACSSNSDRGARSVDALMLVYFNALSAKDVEAFNQLLPSVDLSWGVYNDADRADEKEFRSKAKAKRQGIEEAFRRHAEEFGGVKISVTGLETEPLQQLNVVWSAEPYGKLGGAIVTVTREGKSYKYIFSNIMQYRGKYYLEELPFVDIKRWE